MTRHAEQRVTLNVAVADSQQHLSDISIDTLIRGLANSFHGLDLE